MNLGKFCKLSSHAEGNETLESTKCPYFKHCERYHFLTYVAVDIPLQLCVLIHVRIEIPDPDCIVIRTGNK